MRSAISVCLICEIFIVGFEDLGEREIIGSLKTDSFVAWRGEIDKKCCGHIFRFGLLLIRFAFINATDLCKSLSFFVRLFLFGMMKRAGDYT